MTDKFKIFLLIFIFVISSLYIFFIISIGDHLQFDRRLIYLEPWRLFTCHWTHWSLQHLAWDLVVFAILSLLSAKTSMFKFLMVMTIASLFISLSVILLEPTIIYYRGLSGLDSALFTLLSLELMSKRVNRTLKLLGALMLFLFVAKIGYELSTDTSIFVSNTDFRSLPVAHIAGFISAILVEIYICSFKIGKSIRRV